MAEVQAECKHKNVNYSDPLTCADCGATLGEGIKVVDFKDLPAEKQAAMLKAMPKRTVVVETGDGTPLPMEDVPAEAVPKPAKATKPPKGAMTRLEIASPKERVFVVNGVKFFAAVGQSGHRLLSACDASKKKLESAGRVLLIKGYTVDVKRNKQDKRLWMLSAKEKTPSGPWPDEDPKPAATP
jgi:hypothetical protein